MKKFIVAITALSLSLLLLSGCAVTLPATTPAPASTASSTATPEESTAPVSTEPERTSFGQFTATDLDGNQVTQDIFADYDLTMINIWATFCSPCINEMPYLGELAAEYKDESVQIVGIVVDVLDNTGAISSSQVDLAKEIVQQTGANYTHLLPSDDLIQIKLRYVSAVPETVFVDKNGDIVGDPLVGSRSKDDWKAIIDNYLEDVK